MGNTSIDNAASQQGFKLRLDDYFILARIYKLFSSNRCTTIKDGIDVQRPTYFYSYIFCKIKIDTTISLTSFSGMKTPL